MATWFDGLIRRRWMVRGLRQIGIEPQSHDWSGAKNFLLSLFLLGIALLLALNGAAALERGEKRLMIVCHVVALTLTGYVVVRRLPRLAENTPLRWLFYQVDYKVTREGTVYLAIILVMVLAALNTGNNLLFIILASLLAGILVSGVVSRMVLTGIELSLELPEHIFAGQPILASLTLHNRKNLLPSFSLTARGDPGEKRPATEGEGLRCSGRSILAESVYFPYLPGGKSTCQQVELTFPRRGRYQQDVFHVSSKFPFGFLLKTRQVKTERQIVVYPPVEPTEEFYEILPLLSGELESYSRGRGHDLYSIRSYQPMDSARSVDWKATAKAQELKVREFTREDERRVELVFDPTLPPDAQGGEWEERFERSVAFCACLAWHFHEISAEMKFRTPWVDTAVGRAAEVIYPTLRELALIEPERGASEDGFLARLCETPRLFKVVVTARPRGSIPTDLWTSAYIVFMQSL
jgi:uncharacterized protein (DUF58 family)